MRQLPFIMRRFIYLGIFFIIATIVYGVEEFIDERGPCGDRAVSKWFEQSTSILDKFDYNERAAYTSYNSQQGIDHPECLVE